MKEQYKLEIERNLKTKIIDFEELSSTNNQVYLLRTQDSEFVAKFYSTKGAHTDNEIMLSQLISNEYQKYLKDIVHYDDSCSKIDIPFAIFEKIDGNTLLDLVKSNSIDDTTLQKGIEDIHAFVNGVFEIQATDYGYLKGSLIGSHETWKEFMFDYQVPTSKSLFLNPDTKQMSYLNFQLVSEYYDELFSTNTPIVVPIDLNLSNFMITNSGELKVSDPGSIISGNKLASYGEFTAHTFGTKPYELFKEIADFDTELERKVRGFAALSNLNVLAFLARLNVKDIEKACPWGNTNTFFNLIKGHIDSL